MGSVQSAQVLLFKPINAIALVKPQDGSNPYLSGVVEFNQYDPNNCLIRAQFVGLTPGFIYWLAITAKRS